MENEKQLKALNAMGHSPEDLEDWIAYYNAPFTKQKKADAEYAEYIKQQKIQKEAAAKSRSHKCNNKKKTATKEKPRKGNDNTLSDVCYI